MKLTAKNANSQGGIRSSRAKYRYSDMLLDILKRISLTIHGSDTRTEGTRVHKPPKPCVTHSKYFAWVSRSRNKFGHYTSEDVSDNLEEKLTDADCLRTEILS